MKCVDTLREKGRIPGTRPSLEDLLNPSAESKIGDSSYEFPGGDQEIIAEAKRRALGTNSTDNGGDEAEDEDEDEEAPTEISPREGLELCEKMDRLCLQYAGAKGVDAVVVQGQIRQLRSHLRKEQWDSVKQTTLGRFWAEEQ